VVTKTTKKQCAQPFTCQPKPEQRDETREIESLTMALG
jgi:hypothetical protein